MSEIRVITNANGSGDWTKVYYMTDLIWEGHSLSPSDLVDIINSFYSETGAKLVQVTDEEMETC